MVRFKNRYFVTEIEMKDRPPHAPFLVGNHLLQSCVLKKIQQIHGDFGLASVTTGFRIKYCNPYTKIVLIKSRHGPHRFVGTVLPIIRNIEGHNVQFNILYVGGTMMKCFKFIRASYEFFWFSFPSRYNPEVKCTYVTLTEIKNHQLTSLESYWNKMKSDSDRTRLKAALLKLNL